MASQLNGVIPAGSSASGTQGSSVDLGGTYANHALYVLTSSGTASGVVTLQVSADGTNWFNTGTTITTNAASSEFAAALANFPARFVSAKITTVIGSGTVTAWVCSA